MLRKGSRNKAQQLEQERLAREKALKTREAPRLPAPDLSSFGSDKEGRETSNLLPFTSNGTTNGSTSNFSRPNPGGAMPSTIDPSASSPAYSWRSSSHPASSPAPANGTPGVESHTRTESMTHRGRYSYASNAAVGNTNSPRRIRRRKDPTPFNVLVVGAKNSGKTSFISFLRHSLALPADKQLGVIEFPPQQESIGTFESHYLETEIEGERIGVTLWDSAGLEKSIVDLQLRELNAFVESKFEDTFLEEQKVMRSPGVQDTHIHCVFMILDPVRLDTSIAESIRRDNVVRLDDDLDLQVIRALWGKTTVIPIISKADTLTVKHMAYLKRTVSESLKRSKLDPFEALEFEDDEDDDGMIEEEDEADSASDEATSSDPQMPSKTKRSDHKRQSSISATIATAAGGNDDMPYLPMSVLSPEPYELPPYAPAPAVGEKIGRHFAWGFADPYDPKHCDFIRLRDSIFTEWRGDLRDLARVKWYENWRTSRLRTRPVPRQKDIDIGKQVQSASGAESNGRISNVATTPRSAVASYAATPTNPPSTHPVPAHILKATST